jgi:hypothetical protein
VGVTINGTVVIQPVLTRELTTERDDAGFATATLSLTGYTNRSRADLDAAEEITRQLNEMASNYWYRIVHIADDEDDQYDGMYELLNASVRATPDISNSRAALFGVTVTLRRLGGGGLHGANLTRRVSTVPALQSAAYSHTVLAYVPVPVGAYPLPTSTPSFYTRASEDGTITGISAAAPSPLEYGLSGADVDTGECKLYDTGSGTLRVWSADHNFASDAHVAMDNGLVKVTATTTDGVHAVQAWDNTNTAWADVTPFGAGGDLVSISGGTTHTCRKVVINELSPWRIKVTWHYSTTLTPFLWTKEVTIERGKHLAKVVITPVAAATVTMRPMITTFFMSRRTADINSGYHSTVQTSATLSTATDNVLVGFNATTDDVLCVAAVQATSPAAAVVSSEQRITATSATSLTVHVGGVTYDCVDAQHEAESGTLVGAASTGSGLANDSGNSVVTMGALNAGVNLTAQTTLPAGTRVMAWFRIGFGVAAASANAGDTLKLAIRNSTAGSDAATITLLATDATWFATANTLVWHAIEYTSWNGTDALYPYAVKNGSATANTFFLDEVVFLTMNASGNLDKPRDLANLAMTDQHFWESIDRVVW